MKVIKNLLKKSQIELVIEEDFSELSKYLIKAGENISQNIKIEGFRPGKTPLEVIKKRVGDMVVLEEAAKILISKKIDNLIEENIKPQVAIGTPQISITKLALDNPLEYKVIVDLLPEIKIDNYSGLDIKIEKQEVSEEEVDRVIDQLKEAQVKEVAVNRGCQTGDKVILDIKMFLDNVPLDPGQPGNAVVILGKDYIIPGFDESIIGAKNNDERNFFLVFPKEHHQKNLAGKKVEFNVKIKDVFERQLPELNDDFCLNFGLKKVEELKKNIKNNLDKEKQEKEQRKSEEKILDGLIDRAEFDEFSDFLINGEVDIMMEELEKNISAHGLGFDDYLRSLNKNREDLRKDFLPDAEKRLKAALLMRHIALIEKIEASAEDVAKAKSDLQNYYKYDKNILEKINSKEYERQLAGQIVNKKVLDKLRELNCK